jgi:hypothetical protein
MCPPLGLCVPSRGAAARELGKLSGRRMEPEQFVTACDKLLAFSC